MLARWWMELGFVPLVDRTVSRCVFRGSCGLRNTLGSLSPDGWSCVPALLVVWPEASQHWSLWAVGWDQVLALKCRPPGSLLPVSAPQYIHHKCFCPWSDPQPPPTSPEVPLRPGLARLLWSHCFFPWVPPSALETFVCPPVVVFLFPSVLWSSCAQTPLKLNALGTLPANARPQGGGA